MVPGFTAEASLLPTHGRYRVGAPSGSSLPPIIIPQLRLFLRTEGGRRRNGL
jgi:hypothetical protein